MPRLTEIAHEHLQRVLQPGDIAVDATAGNGFDTLFLARCVGPEGRVYACDVQETAMARVRERLAAEGISNVVLVVGCHAQLERMLPPEVAGRIAAATFNLGYLPGSDRQVITRPATTLPALKQALARLRPQGIITVLAYPGHPGGAEETAAVEDFLETLPNTHTVTQIPSTPSPASPRLFVIRRSAP